MTAACGRAPRLQPFSRRALRGEGRRSARLGGAERGRLADPGAASEEPHVGDARGSGHFLKTLDERAAAAAPEPPERQTIRSLAGFDWRPKSLIQSNQPATV